MRAPFSFMDICAPTWQLASERCPCCNGQSELAFAACRLCGFVILVCAEVGTVFEISGQSRGEHIGWLRGEPDLCAQCRGLRYENFRHATAEEIQRLGFRPGSYR